MVLVLLSLEESAVWGTGYWSHYFVAVSATIYSSPAGSSLRS